MLQHIFGSGGLGYYWAYYSQGVCVYIDINVYVCGKNNSNKKSDNNNKEKNKDSNDDDNSSKNLGW